MRPKYGVILILVIFSLNCAPVASPSARTSAPPDTFVNFKPVRFEPIKRTNRPWPEQVDIFVEGKAPTKQFIVLGDLWVGSIGLPHDRMLEIARQKAVAVGGDAILDMKYHEEKQWRNKRVSGSEEKMAHLAGSEAVATGDGFNRAGKAKATGTEVVFEGEYTLYGISGKIITYVEHLKTQEK